MADNTLPSDRTGIGPQSTSDTRFRRRMRLHQSWYRHEVLCVPYGSGPNPSSTTPYGNMLDGESAEQGLNFLSPGIHSLAKERIAEAHGAVASFRLLRNMLTSQAMCFNLFGELALDLELATVLARSLWGDHVVDVTSVRFEWAPSPRGDYLDDRTAFDAVIEYEAADGQRGFIGVETKLTEPFLREGLRRGGVPSMDDAGRAVAYGCGEPSLRHRAQSVVAGPPACMVVAPALRFGIRTRAFDRRLPRRGPGHA